MTHNPLTYRPHSKITTAMAERADRLRAEARQAQVELDRHLIANAPLKPGDVVEARWRGQWHPAIVRVVEVSTVGKTGTRYWYRVSLRRKDGGWRDATVRVFADVRPAEAHSTT